MDNVHDVEDYMKELLDSSDSRVQLFLSHFLKQWKQPVIKPLAKSKQSIKESSNSNNREKSQTLPSKKLSNNIEPSRKPPIKFYQKNKSGEEYFGGTTKKSKSKGAKPKVPTSNEVSNKVPTSNEVSNKVPTSSESQSNGMQPKTTTENVSKKKKKFVSLYSNEGVARTVVKLPGRHSCDCQALKHDLVNNCIECGRIVCAQEGAGPCLFCSNLVCSREQENILAEGTKKSEKLRQILMKDTDKVLQLINNQILKLSTENGTCSQSAELSKAVDYKNRLLDYDNTSVKRTQVIDDDADYFNTDSQWLSKSEREVLKRREDELRNIRFQSKRECKVTFDFAGRRIIDEEEEAFNSGTNMYEEEKTKLQNQVQETSRMVPRNNDIPLGNLVDPSIKIAAPKFVQPKDQIFECSFSKAVEQGKRSSIRLQDKEIQEMKDDGCCLSMHQPYASLLIAGIKLHEGRTWYTSHRGKLWIASTAKPPLQDEIDSLENSYHVMYKGANIVFPKFYQPGCLLGCVDLVDCLEQGEYRTQFPNGESGSPYVFICHNPKELVVNFPIKGKHKIFKLDPHIHQGAKKGLRKAVYDER